MKETKHTPGPWHIYANDAYLAGKTPINLVSVYAGEMPREHIVCNSYDPDDAKLIAAAPELLEACKDLLAWVDQHECDGAFLRSQNAARQAIAKAEGRAAV